MSVVLVHIGCTGPYITSMRPPAHLVDCIDQYRLFNDDDLYILTDRDNLQYIPKRDGVLPFAIEDYHSDKVSRFESLYNFGSQDFWTVSITRFIYIENFLRENDLRHVYHFGNDVLVFFNIKEYAHVFRQLYENNIAVTPCAPGHLTAGFVYVDGYMALEHMTNFFVDVLSEIGIAGMIRKYHVDMVNDMTLMRCYVSTSGAGRVGLLPVLPFGEFSQGFDQFGAIFDAASWGHFIDGTRTSDGKGVRIPGHYVGAVLLAHPQYDVVWKVENGLRVPYFMYDDNMVKLNTLHIQSKKTHLYMSR